jgi:hypothetical protein
MVIKLKIKFSVEPGPESIKSFDRDRDQDRKKVILYIPNNNTESTIFIELLVRSYKTLLDFVSEFLIWAHSLRIRPRKTQF